MLFSSKPPDCCIPSTASLDTPLEIDPGVTTPTRNCRVLLKSAAAPLTRTSLVRGISPCSHAREVQQIHGEDEVDHVEFGESFTGLGMQFVCCPGLGGVRSVLHGFVDLHRSTFSSVHIDVHVDSVAVDEFGIFQDA